MNKKPPEETAQDILNRYLSKQYLLPDGWKDGFLFFQGLLDKHRGVYCEDNQCQSYLYGLRGKLHSVG